MDLTDPQTLLNGDRLPRGPLPSGFDPWARAAYDKKEAFVRAHTVALARHGVQVTCIRCGAARTVHPANAARTKYCPPCRRHHVIEFNRERRERRLAEKRRRFEDLFDHYWGKKA